MRSFTPLIFGTNSGMGADCNCFLKRLAEKLSEKNEEPYHITITWIRTLLSFEILRSLHTCVRGSRTPFYKIPRGNSIDDCRLNASQACVFNGFIVELFLLIKPQQINFSSKTGYKNNVEVFFRCSQNLGI